MWKNLMKIPLKLNTGSQISLNNNQSSKLFVVGSGRMSSFVA